MSKHLLCRTSAFNYRKAIAHSHRDLQALFLSVFCFCSVLFRRGVDQPALVRLKVNQLSKATLDQAVMRLYMCTRGHVIPAFALIFGVVLCVAPCAGEVRTTGGCYS